MIIILVALCVRGKICPGRIDGKALLFPPVMLALTIGEQAFLGVLHSCMGYFYGVEAQNAADFLKYSLREIFTDWNFVNGNVLDESDVKSFRLSLLQYSMAVTAGPVLFCGSGR